MKVSAVIVAHNYADFVEEAVESVLRQDYSGPLECVVVDDGSTDGTREILERLAPRIRCVSQPNLGQPAGLNAGYAVSTGDVLCLLDADDVWKPHKVRRVVEEMAKDPTVGLVHHEVEAVDRGGHPVPFSFGRYTRADGDVSGDLRKKGLPWMFNPTSSLSVRRTICPYIFPLLTGLRGSGDDFVATSASLLAPVKHVAEALSFYRIHGRNLWASTSGDAQSSLRREEARPRESAPWEDLDLLDASRRRVRLLERVTVQANLCLSRAGLPGGLSPWINSDYLMCRAELDRVSPWKYVPHCLAALARVGGVPWGEKLRAGARVLRRVERRRRTSRGSGLGPPATRRGSGSWEK